MRTAILALVFVGLMGGAAYADEYDLTGGVLICHAPPMLVYTATIPDYCTHYETIAMFDCCQDQINEFPCDNLEAFVWYILSQFYEPKTFNAIEMGISYDPDVYSTVQGGICCPGAFMTIEYPSAGAWPGNGSAIAASTTEVDWSGDCVVTHWLSGYAYCAPYGPGQGTINLVTSPQTGFIGWASMSGICAAECIGAMGIGQPGEACCSVRPPDLACCMPDGSCVDVFTEDACDALGGVLYPEACALTDCPQPPDPEACCFPDGSCQMLLEGACVHAGGTFYPGQDCATFECPIELMACCMPDGSCEDVLTEDACDALGGILYPDPCALTNCPPPPDPEACCMPDGSCVDVFGEGACDALGGILYPEVCALTDCPPPPDPEACCFPDGSCQMLLEGACVHAGGTFYPGQDCATFECPIELMACCVSDGSCADVLSQAVCDDMGGLLYPENYCAEPGFECPPCVEAACCLPDESCVDVCEAECADIDGIFFPADYCDSPGFECPPPPPEFACCFPDDETCTMMPEADCHAAGGCWFNGRICESAGGDFTCPPVAVCCRGERCSITAQENCAGEWHPEWDSCGPPNPCECPVPNEPASWGAIKALYR